MSGDEAARQQRETRENWALRAGQWQEQADHLARLAHGLNTPLVAAAGVGAGHHVLDLASGVGEPALSMSELVGPDGSVTATDLVPEMLAGAEKRAGEKGLTNMKFQVTPMEELPFDDESFDAVTCRIGLMYTPTPERAAAQACRVLRPGCRAAFLVWGPKADNSQFIVVDRVLSEVAGIDPHEGAFTPTRLGDDGALNKVLQAGGFSTWEEQALRFSPRVDLASNFWRPQLALRIGDRLATMADDERQRIDGAMRAAYADLVDGDRVQLQVHARIGVGTV
ncbi:MAG: methyltransferase domain-containing protein [Rhodospirillaceae bacterium]|jgi:SAM-dependent methyltransferase|nr:methyltransferase domain-containing protein [Rhodospirillaceae bacterium]MBT5897919.1 methyltransferase domain-containing protein [Rhodospirillaceae bacterium]MBT6431128.1 methyltransferase domain-containing protein [Rhodospirillaceae bacterium]